MVSGLRLTRSVPAIFSQRHRNRATSQQATISAIATILARVPKRIPPRLCNFTLRPRKPGIPRRKAIWPSCTAVWSSGIAHSFWMRVAEGLGATQNRPAIEKVKAKLTAEQIDTAEKRITDWLQQHKR